MTQNKKLQSFSVVAEQASLPSLSSMKSNGYYTYGIKNDYPYRLYQAYIESATHSALVDRKVDLIYGQGVIVENPAALDEYIRFGNEDLNSLVTKLAFDYILYGGFALKVVNSASGAKYKNVKHLSYAGIRYSTDLDQDYKSKSVYFSNDWRNSRVEENRPVIYSLNTNDDIHVITFTNPIPSFLKYPEPSYIGGIASILTEPKIELFHLRNIENNYAPTLIIKLKKEMSEEDFEAFSQGLKGYQGPQNAGGCFIVGGETPETTPDIVPLDIQLKDNLYKEQVINIKNQIYSAHKVTNPSIASQPSSSAFSNGQELQIAYELFERLVISKSRNEIVKVLNTIFKDTSWGFGNITINPINLDLEKYITNTNNQIQTTNQK